VNSIVCFQWNIGFRDYRAEYVNVLARSIRRHLPMPHRFICVTEETDGFDAGVEVLPLPEAARAVADLVTPERRGFPSSYRRLWALSEEARILGDRVMMLDIDCVITGDLSPLFEVDVDFVGWRPNFVWGNGEKRIGGGTWLLRTGTRAEVWERFSANPAALIAEARAAGFRGSDQAILSYMLQGCALWPMQSGIYQAQDMKELGLANLPADARIVHFNGKRKPWDCVDVPWIREHWC
jgi:hypothetical protein